MIYGFRDSKGVLCNKMNILHMDNFRNNLVNTIKSDTDNSIYMKIEFKYFNSRDWNNTNIDDNIHNKVFQKFQREKTPPYW